MESSTQEKVDSKEKGSTITMDDITSRWKKPPTPEGGSSSQSSGFSVFTDEAPKTDFKGFTKDVDPDDVEIEEEGSGNSFTGGAYGDPSRASMVQAKFVGKLTDMGFGNIGKAISQDESSRPYRADKEDLEDLIEVLAIYIEESGRNIPPGVLVLLCVVFVYGPKMMTAVEVRQRKKKGVKNHYITPDPPSSGSSSKQDDEEVIDYTDDAHEYNEADLNFRLSQTHEMVDNNIQDVPELRKFKDYNHPPSGYCIWEWFIEGREVQLRGTQKKFSKQIYSNWWISLQTKYKQCGIPWPPDWMEE